MEAANTATGIIIWIVLALIYFIPYAIAHSRKNPNTGAVFVVNFFLGWTGIGWVIALVMAVWKSK